MFTGIIAELGEVISLQRSGESGRLALRSRRVSVDAALGDSIAVNGVCLTVTELNGGTLSFDVSYETLRSTNLGTLRHGDKVNLEPSLRPTSKLGGHFVTGHVEGTGTLRSRARTGNAERIEIAAPEDILRYVVEKGSIAIDGISLTVVDNLMDGFTIVIIPHTATITTIGFKKVGDTVNLEPDILAKYVAKLLGRDTGRDARHETLAPGRPEDHVLSALKKSGFID